MAFETITLVGSTVSGEVGPSTATVSPNLPAGTAEGDIVVVACASAQNAVAGGVTTSGYVDVLTISSAQPGRQMKYKVMGATPDTTVTIAGVASLRMAYIIQTWRNVDNTDVLDQTTPAEVTASSSSTVDPAAITTVTDGALVMAFYYYDDGDAPTVSSYSSGYSNTGYQGAGGANNQDGTVAIASKTVATAGTENPGALTWSKQADYTAALTIALRPATTPIPLKSINGLARADIKSWNGVILD